MSTILSSLRQNQVKTINYQKAPFEVVHPNLYSKKAYYSGFRTTADRLSYWIQAIFLKVYVDIEN